VASTKSYFDKESQRWIDGTTSWFTIKCFRSLARNVSKSVKKADPIIVEGNLSVEEWESSTGSRTDYVVEALSLGHNLQKGVTSFRYMSQGSRENDVSEIDSAVSDAEIIEVGA
jgi:single-strand DNA-binding protein